MQHICKINISLTDGIITIIAPPALFRHKPMRAQAPSGWLKQQRRKPKNFHWFWQPLRQRKPWKRQHQQPAEGCRQAAMAQMVVPGSVQTACQPTWQANLSLGRPRWASTQTWGRWVLQPSGKHLCMCAGSRLRLWHVKSHVHKFASTKKPKQPHTTMLAVGVLQLPHLYLTDTDT